MLKILLQAKKSFANYSVAKVITTKTPRISAATRFKTSHKRESSLSGLSSYNLTGYIFALISSLIRSSLRSPDVSPIRSRLVCIHATPPWDTASFAGGVNGINLNIRESIVSIFSTSVTKLLSLIMAAFLIVSCAAGVVGVDDGSGVGGGPGDGPGDGGGSVGGASTPLSLLSLPSITFFAMDNGGRLSTTFNSTDLPRVLLNQVEIKRQVAAELGINPNDDEAIQALQEPGNYSIEIVISADFGSPQRRYFQVERDPTNPDLIVLSIRGNQAGVTKTEVFGLIEGSLTVEVTVNIPKTQDDKGSTISNKVKVNLRIGDTLDLNKALSFTIPGDETLTQNKSLAENIHATSDTAIILPNNALSTYGLEFNDPESRTVFFALENAATDIANVNNTCEVGIPSQGFVYYDNSDNRIKVSTSFNYENGTAAPVANCRLAISVDGEIYKWVGLPVAKTNTNVDGVAVSSTDLNLNNGDNFAIANITSVAGVVDICRGTTYTCYYPSLNINISDVDEAPVISLLGKAASFAGSFEGDVPSAGPNIVAAVGDAPLTEKLLDANKLVIRDADYVAGQRGTYKPISASAYSVTSNPATAGLFSVSPDSTGTADQFDLVVSNSSKLDYETFPSFSGTPAAGKAIYEIMITATDATNQSTTKSFDYEVKDVIYTPVTSYTPPGKTAPLSGLGFVKNTNIPAGPKGMPLYLLSGVEPFSNNRHHLGTFKAVDPETGSDDSLLYSVVPINASKAKITEILNALPSTTDPLSLNNPNVIDRGRNFGILKNPKDPNNTIVGGRLVLTGTSLPNDQQNHSLTIMAIHQKASKFGVRSSLATTDATKTIVAGLVTFFLFLSEDGVSAPGFIDPRAIKVLEYNVDSSKYIPDPNKPNDLTNLIRPDAIKFTTGVVIGKLSEAATNENNVTFTVPNSAASPPATIETAVLTAAIDTTAVTAPAPVFGFVDNNFINVLKTTISVEAKDDLARLNVNFNNPHVSIFDINTTTGSISIKSTGSGVEFGRAYNLLVYVANGTADPANDLTTSDILTVSVEITDVNTAPVLSDYTVISPATTTGAGVVKANEATATTPATAAQVNLEIAEDVATVGTELLRFTVDDDNDRRRANFPSNARIIDGTFSLSYEEVKTTVGNAIVSSIQGVVSLASGLDYETQSSNMSTITVTDQGIYSYNHTDDSTRPDSAITNRVTASTSFTLNLAVTDSVEVPVIAAADTQGKVSELAPINTTITGLDLSLMNINDFGGANNINSSEFSYTIDGDSRSAIKLSNVFGATIDANGKIQLRVTDAKELERLGDGEEFALSLNLIRTTTATPGKPATTAKSNTINNIIVLVEDERPMINNFASSSGGGSIAIKPINEADVDGVGEIPFILQDINDKNFVLRIEDFVTDVDDTDLSFSITAQSVANNGSLASPGLVNPTIVELVDNPTTTTGGTVIRLVNTDFIDANLFGALDLTITLVDANSISVINEDPKRNAKISVTVAPASPKNLVLGGPFNTVSYTQSDYADPFTLTATEEAALSSKIIDYNSAAVNSSTVNKGEIIRLSDTKLYNTTNIIPSDTGNLTDGGTFIARDTKKLSPFTVTIPVTSASSIAAVALDVLDKDNFQVLVERDGKLIVAPADFNKYFAVTFNNTVNSVSNSKQIIITQRVATRPAVADDTTTPEDESSPAVSYQLLDTIPLFPDGKESTQLSFFIRAINNTAGGGNDASEYDLAQFNVEVEAASTNEPTVISRIALVPSGTTVPDTPTSSPKADLNALFGITDAIPATKDASGNWVLDIPENGIISGATNLAVNNFASGYKLVVEFSNPDAVEEKEAASNIVTALAAGSATGIDNNDPTNNIADNGNLLAIQSASDDDSNTPGGGVSFNNDSPAHAAGQNYTLSYDFALAQNLAGAAMITFAVDDKEEGTNEVLSTATATLTINVMPIARDTSTDVAVNTISLGGTLLDTATPPSFTEDMAPLPTIAMSSRDVALTYGYTSDTSNIQRSAQVNLVSVDNTFTGQVDHNPLDKEFITRVDRETIQYVAHGWGSQQLNFGIEYTESRGFAVNVAPVNTKTVSYPAVGTGTNNVVADRMIKVTNENDATTYETVGTLDNILATEFIETTDTTITKTKNIIFADNDLLFDTLNNVLGTVSVTVTPITTPPLNVAISSLTQDPSNTAQANAMLTYSITLNSNSALSAAKSTYKFSFDFTASAATALPDAATVEFVESQSDPRIVDSGTDSAVFPTDGTAGVATRTENQRQSSPALARLEIEDLDLNKNINASTLTYSITAGDDLVKWLEPNKIGSGTTSTRFTNSLFLQRELLDADVKTHLIEWLITDTRGDPLTGSFNLIVTGVNDTPSFSFSDEVLIAVNAPNADTPLNVNTGTDGISVNITLNDDDFFEVDPLVTVTEITYDTVSFILDKKTDASSPTDTCTVEARGVKSKLIGDITSIDPALYDRITSGSLEILNEAMFFNDAPLTVNNIQTATGCGPDEIKIGTKIIKSQFVTLKVIDSYGVDSTGTELDVERGLVQQYVFQGYRTKTHTSQDIAKVVIDPGASGVINFIVTDGDPDDGTAHDPTLNNDLNIVRTADGTAAAWGQLGSLTATPATGGSCTGVTIGTIGGYADNLATTDTDDSVAVIPYTTDPSASGTCVITITDSGEDGKSVSKTATILSETAPTIGTIVSDVGATIDTVAEYGSNFIITTPVTDNDNDDDRASTNGVTINYAVDSSSTRICSIVSTTMPTLSFDPHNNLGIAITSPDPSVEVTPLKPGDCTISITVAENGASSMKQTTVTLAEIAPLVALTVDGTKVTPDSSGDISPTISRDVIEGESIPVVFTITKQDPGDTFNANIRVAAAKTNIGCTISYPDGTKLSLSQNKGINIQPLYDAQSIGGKFTATIDIVEDSSNVSPTPTPNTDRDCDSVFRFMIYEVGDSSHKVTFTLTINAANGFTFKARDKAPQVSAGNYNVSFYSRNNTAGSQIGEKGSLLDPTTITYGTNASYRVALDINLTDTDVFMNDPERDNISITYNLLGGGCVFPTNQSSPGHSSTITKMNNSTAVVTLPGFRENTRINIVNRTAALISFTSPPNDCTANLTSVEEGGLYANLTGIITNATISPPATP